MSQYTFQLLLGVMALVLWGGVFLRWQRGPDISPLAQLCIVVGFISALLILPFGSLRLMDVIDDILWGMVGTVGRIVVVVCGLVALLAED